MRETLTKPFELIKDLAELSGLARSTKITEDQAITNVSNFVDLPGSNEEWSLARPNKKNNTTALSYTDVKNRPEAIYKFETLNGDLVALSAYRLSGDGARSNADVRITDQAIIRPLYDRLIDNLHADGIRSMTSTNSLVSRELTKRILGSQKVDQSFTEVFHGDSFLEKKVERSEAKQVKKEALQMQSTDDAEITKKLFNALIPNAGDRKFYPRHEMTFSIMHRPDGIFVLTLPQKGNYPLRVAVSSEGKMLDFGGVNPSTEANLATRTIPTQKDIHTALAAFSSGERFNNKRDV